MHEARCTVCPPARFRPFGFPPRGTTTPGYSTLSKMEKINSQQAREATENQFTFASGGWGYPPDPTLTEIQDRRDRRVTYSQQHSGYTRLLPPR